MKKVLYVLIVGIVAIAFFACKDDNSLTKLRRQELALLDEFISINYPNSLPKPSGLYYIEEVPGTGDSIKTGDKVQIFYATWTIDSLLIDETNGYTQGYRYEPLEFTVGDGTTITGLNEAVTYMKQGTVANLVIPSELAYGQNGSYTSVLVPGFTTLLMQVEVYKVYKATTSQ